MAEFSSKPKPNMFNPTIISNKKDNDVDTEVEYITKGIRNISPRSNNSSGLSNRPKLSITPFEPKNPTEEEFINFYFKDKDTNENIKRIYKKYIEVKNTIIDDAKKIDKNYEEGDKGTIKSTSSVGWEIILNNIAYKYKVDKQMVTHSDGSMFKEFQFGIDNNVTLFMITLEIAMQKVARDLLEDVSDIIIPNITKHYLIKVNDNENQTENDHGNQYNRLIIEMEFIENKDLEFNNISKAKNALKKLRENNIYHFDTHHKNIVQSVKDDKVESVKDDKVVILDFGKAQITQNPDISSTTGLYEKRDGSSLVDPDDPDDPPDNPKWYQNWLNGITPGDSQIIIRDTIDFYGGKKNKSKRKTKKGKKKGKSKKTKKRTYRKRK